MKLRSLILTTLCFSLWAGISRGNHFLHDGFGMLVGLSLVSAPFNGLDAFNERQITDRVVEIENNGGRNVTFPDIKEWDSKLRKADISGFSLNSALALNSVLALGLHKHYPVASKALAVTGFLISAGAVAANGLSIAFLNHMEPDAKQLPRYVQTNIDSRERSHYVVFSADALALLASIPLMVFAFRKAQPATEAAAAVGV